MALSATLSAHRDRPKPKRPKRPSRPEPRVSTLAARAGSRPRDGKEQQSAESRLQAMMTSFESRRSDHMSCHIMSCNIMSCHNINWRTVRTSVLGWLSGSAWRHSMCTSAFLTPLPIHVTACPVTESPPRGFVSGRSPGPALGRGPPLRSRPGSPSAAHRFRRRRSSRPKPPR